MHNHHRKLYLLQLIAMIFLMFFLNACNKSNVVSPETIAQVKAVMEKRAQAIKNKDMELFKQVFLPDYNDGKNTYQDIVEGMAENFRNYESIAFTYQRSPVDLSMNSARMVGTVSYQGNSMDKAVFDHEITQFRRVDGQWYISGGVNVVVF